MLVWYVSLYFGLRLESCTHFYFFIVYHLNKIFDTNQSLHFVLIKVYSKIDVLLSLRIFKF